VSACCVFARRGRAIQDEDPRPYESDPEKGFTMDIMMMMDMDKVSSLRGEFQQKGRGLSISEFVRVMMRFVQSSPDTDENSRLRNLPELQLVANLCELFAQIDINGDGSMEWEEFTSFIVDTGLTVKSHQPNSIQLYHHVPWEDASKHSTFIDHVRPPRASTYHLVLTGLTRFRADLLLPVERRGGAGGELQPLPQDLQHQLRADAVHSDARRLRSVCGAPPKGNHSSGITTG
jgi:hypothetical protein